MAEERRDGVQEVKFVLAPAQVERVLDWMRASLAPDPHGGGTEADAYRVESIYYDTPAFDVYHRRGSFGRAKFRIRRYGESPLIFLERKLKRGGVVRKRRVAVGPERLADLALPVNGHRWEGSWFHRRAELRSLGPTVMMNYFRIARLGQCAEGRFRVTLDRDLRAVPASGARIPVRIEGPDLLGDQAILEVKFPLVLPGPFRVLMEEAGLVIGGFSKFRRGIQACGLVREPAEAPAPAPGSAGEPGAAVTA